MSKAKNKEKMIRFNGVLLLDKPKGWTSHDLVMRTRSLLGQKEVGHAGTLDPLATGLMILLLGDATKMSNYLLEANKGYEVRVKFGIETDTLDITGKVLSKNEITVESEDVARVVASLQGDIELPIPKFSAVKRDGKKLCDVARRGEEVVSPLRVMNFYDVALQAIGSDFAVVSLDCTKGSYIRSWASHLGELTGYGATVDALVRTKSQPYSLDQAIDFKQLSEIFSLFDPKSSDSWEMVPTMTAALQGAFIPLVEMLPHWKAVTVSGRDEQLVLNGQIPNDLLRRLIFEQKEANRLQKTLGIKILGGDEGRLLSLLEARPKEGLKIRRVFNRTT